MKQLCKVIGPERVARVGIVENQRVAILPAETGSLASLLADPALPERLPDLTAHAVDSIPLESASLLAPIDNQEVWAAGVTYQRSQHARMEESEHAASFYDRVYSAPRPELFLKATPHRVVGPGQPVRVRTDTQWCVPEPEITLVLSPDLRLVGFTIGNDMSARDIEGENPLYLPQAKVYDQCAALGPVITLTGDMPSAEDTKITLVIERGGSRVFEGQTSVAAMNRTFEELIGWLGRDNSFPEGAFLMTGTGIVPPDDFTLARGDIVSITIAGIGTLTNPVTIGS